MQNWVVRVECEAVASPDQLQRIAQHVAGIEQIVAASRLALELRLTALSLRQVVNESLDQAHIILQQAGITGTPLAAHATTESDYLKRLAAQPDLDIVGIAEIQEMLNIKHRQQADQLARRNDFPAPFKTLVCGRIWLRSDIERFARTWRRRPGRPGR